MKLRLIIFFGIIAGITLLLVPKRTPTLVNNRPLSGWIQDLSLEDYQQRTTARTALLGLGEGAVPDLIKQLQIQPWPAQENLEKVAVRFTRRTIRWPRPTLARQRALPILAELGPKASGAVPAVVENLVYPDSNVSLEAERVLRRVGPSAVQGLAHGLRSPNPHLRTACARVLKDCTGFDPTTLALLRERVQVDSVPEVRAAAIRTVAWLKPDDRELRAVLLKALQDSNPEVRIAAVQSVEDSNLRSPEGLDQLRHCLADSFVGVRFQAAQALWHLTRDQTVTSVLIDCLHDRKVGWQAAYLMGAMKTQDWDAINALIQALQRERVDRPLRSPPSTSFALGQIGRAAIVGLIPILENPDPKVRTASVLALGFMRGQAKESIPALLPLLKDRNTEVRQATALALAAIEPGGNRAMAVLIEMLHAEDIYVRMDAADALRKIDPATNWQIASE